jgi:hypothetical protein
VVIVAKQLSMRVRGIAIQSDVGPIMVPKALATAPSTSKTNKVVPDDILEDLIKDFKELKVEMSALRRNQRPSTSRLVEGSKGVCDKVHLL